MKAAVYHGAGVIRIETLPDPVAGAGELVVAMAACGLCGSDLMRWYQDPRAPVVLGHEPVGVVTQVGPGAGFAAGERVFVHHHVPCFTCELCRRGRHTLCARFRETAIDPGGLAELIRVPAENVAADVLRIPDHVDDVTATLIEPVACIIRGQRMAGVGEGSRVAVVGAGSMGLLEIQVARALGAGPIVAIEPDPARAARAAACGAVVADGLDARAVRAALNGHLADQVFVCTHSEAAIAEAPNMAGAAGVVQLFAVPEPGHRIPLDLGAVFFREVTLQSTYSAGPEDTRAALAMIASGHIDTSSVITHVLPLQDAYEGYRLAASGKALKVCITSSQNL